MVACRESAEAGQKVLIGKGSALEAVETAVRILEDDPALDAGRGSYPNIKGQIEMDALIMDGSTLNLGAVAAVQQIKNPITLARLIMTDCEHNILVGLGAEEFAESVGIERCQLEDLIFHWPDSVPAEALKDGNPLSISRDPTSDTVGAVALDSFGNLAAATSTGGIRNKYPGRVGDSPLVGSGAYADNLTAAVSATGDGESLMKIVVSKQVCDLVANGLSAQQACEVTIKILGDRVRGLGGLIAVDYLGGLGSAFNTTAMPYAFAVGQGAIEAAYSSPSGF
jgi:beta-aspartyl-peptidase (threonine type)